MKKRTILAFLLLVFTLAAQAQSNFIFTPEKPVAGDVITITYTPAGELSNTSAIEGVAYLKSNNNIKAMELALTKNGNKYSTSIQTDTSNNFVQLGFKVDEKFDNNFNQGFYILLYEGKNVKPLAYASLGEFYEYDCARTEVDRNQEKALAAYEQELSLYPDRKKMWMQSYYALLTAVKKNDAMPFIKKEIEAVQASGMNTEFDFYLLQRLYKHAKMQDQAKLINAQMKEKFPEGDWIYPETMNKYRVETNIDKKLALLPQLKKQILKEHGETASALKEIDYLAGDILKAYGKNRQWVEFRKFASEMSDKNVLAIIYNSVAWNLQTKSQDLGIAEELSQFATEYAKKELTNPSEEKPDFLLPKEWKGQREYAYSTYADTYAMVLYRLQEYKKGFGYAREAALTFGKGMSPEQNLTYALLGEKVLPANELKDELERFVKNGAAQAPVKEMLKKLYAADKGSDAGFEEYIAGLERELYLKMVEKMKKSMISEKAPSFELVDLEGNTVKTSGLKGKVVIIDFWATWCGPCVSSFPNMQKLVDKYQDNPDVKFVFINSWERGDKQKKVSEFISSKKYTFQVLMDNDDKVIGDYFVRGIPTKFVLDKEGNIRFRTSGGGTSDRLVMELDAMIALALGEKTF